MPDLSDTVAKCRMGTAKKFYTSIASLSHISKDVRNVSEIMDVKYGKMTEECVKIFHRADISANKIQKSETEAL